MKTADDACDGVAEQILDRYQRGDFGQSQYWMNGVVKNVIAASLEAGRGAQDQAHRTDMAALMIIVRTAAEGSCVGCKREEKAVGTEDCEHRLARAFIAKPNGRSE